MQRRRRRKQAQWRRRNPDYFVGRRWTAALDDAPAAAPTTAYLPGAATALEPGTVMTEPLACDALFDAGAPDIAISGGILVQALPGSAGIVHHLRERKTGPQIPVAVVQSRTHRQAFTL